MKLTNSSNRTISKENGNLALLKLGILHNQIILSFRYHDSFVGVMFATISKVEAIKTTK